MDTPSCKLTIISRKSWLGWMEKRGEITHSWGDVVFIPWRLPSPSPSIQVLMNEYYLGGTHRYPWKQDGYTPNAWLSSLSGKNGHTDWYDTLHSLPCHKYIYSTRLLLPSARFVRGSVVGNQEFFMSLFPFSSLLSFPYSLLSFLTFFPYYRYGEFGPES